MQDIPLDQLVPTTPLYLTKDDVGEEGVNLTIAGFKLKAVGHGDTADQRCIMGFVENVKPMVVNKTNMGRVKRITGATTTGEARGKTINVYNDPEVEYAGKLTGGIRVRPAVSEAPPPAPVANDGFEDFDDIPY